jgi:RNA polymerase sigma-70 factor (ECF subfamily)
MSDLDAHLPGIVAGDADAFARWVAGSEARLRLSLAAFAAQVDVEALLQETLLRIWQVAPRHVPDGGPNSLLRLAVRVGRNLAIDELRRTRPDLVEASALARLIDGAETVEPIAPDPLLRKVLADCRGRLKGKPALAFTARLDSGGAEPDETVAARLGMRTNTFLQNCTRARKLLSDCLEKHGVSVEAAR